MSSPVNPQHVREWLQGQFDQHIDPVYAEGMKQAVPGAGSFKGIRVPVLRTIARDATNHFKLEPLDWQHFLNLVVGAHVREEIVVGAIGLGKGAAELDDLFGERVGGWARELDNWETTDQLSLPVGYWVMDDWSRLGYLEAWAVNGETTWKKRLAAASTVQFNHGGRSCPEETFRVLRHLMTHTEKEIWKAVAWALREVSDLEAVEKFLQPWAGKVRKGFMTEATKKLSEEARQRLLEG